MDRFEINLSRISDHYERGESRSL